MFERLGIDGGPEAALAALAGRAPDLAPLVEPMLRVTLAPTRAAAGGDYNVIPAAARIDVDCRVPPGLDEAQVLARVREVLGEDGYRLEFTEVFPGNASPPASPLMDALDAWVEATDPGARCLPSHLAGLQRLDDVPRRVPRPRRLRLLPAPAHAGRAGRGARARARRAHRRARPRPGGRLLRVGRQGDAVLAAATSAP